LPTPSENHLRRLTGEPDGVRSRFGPGRSSGRVASDGTQAYFAHYTGGAGPGSASVLRVGPAGELSRQGAAVPTGSNGAEAIALDPAGRRLYVANINTDEPGSVTMFAVGASGGIQRLGRPIQTGGRQPDFGGVVIG
jgi:hypothetical protein